MTRVTLVLALPLGTGVLLFNHDLVVAWVGPAQYAGRLLTTSLAALCVMFALQRVAVTGSFVMGWIKLLSATALIQAIAYIGLSFWLGRRLGLGGITLSLVLVVVPQNIILWLKMAGEFDVKPIALVAGIFMRSVVPLGCAAAVAWLVHSHVIVRRHHLQGFFAESAAFVIVYCVLAYFLLLENIDRDDVNRYLRSILDRGRSVQMLVRRALKVA